MSSIHKIHLRWTTFERSSIDKGLYIGPPLLELSQVVFDRQWTFQRSSFRGLGCRGIVKELQEVFYIRRAFKICSIAIGLLHDYLYISLKGPYIQRSPLYLKDPHGILYRESIFKRFYKDGGPSRALFRQKTLKKRSLCRRRTFSYIKGTLIQDLCVFHIHKASRFKNLSPSFRKWTFMELSIDRGLSIFSSQEIFKMPSIDIHRTFKSFSLIKEL